VQNSAAPRTWRWLRARARARLAPALLGFLQQTPQVGVPVRLLSQTVELVAGGASLPSLRRLRGALRLGDARLERLAQKLVLLELHGEHLGALERDPRRASGIVQSYVRRAAAARFLRGIVPRVVNAGRWNLERRRETGVGIERRAVPGVGVVPIDVVRRVVLLRERRRRVDFGTRLDAFRRVERERVRGFRNARLVRFRNARFGIARFGFRRRALRTRRRLRRLLGADDDGGARGVLKRRLCHRR